MVWLVRRPVIKLPRLAPPADQVKRIHGAVIISALCSCRVSEVRLSFCVAEVNSNNKRVRVYVYLLGTPASLYMWPGQGTEVGTESHLIRSEYCDADPIRLHSVQLAVYCCDAVIVVVVVTYWPGPGDL